MKYCYSREKKCKILMIVLVSILVISVCGVNICVAQETALNRADSLEKLTALEYIHELPKQNTAMADLNGIYVLDSRGKKKEKSFKMDSLRLTMKVSHHDLWKKYVVGHFECSTGAAFVVTGTLAVISGLVVNLTTNSQKQTVEKIADQKRTGKCFLITGGALVAIGIPLFTIGLNKQQIAIKTCTERIQDRKSELQFRITSGGFGLALKF
jgi:hypothetical protein